MCVCVMKLPYYGERTVNNESIIENGIKRKCNTWKWSQKAGVKKG